MTRNQGGPAPDLGSPDSSRPDFVRMDMCDMALGIMDATPGLWDGSRERDPVQVALMNGLNREGAALSRLEQDSVLEYSHSVRTPFFSGCYRLASVADDMVLACNYSAHRVALVDAQGRIVKEADHPFRHPWEAFAGSDGLWWIGNLGSPRVVALDRELNVVREIRLDHMEGIAESNDRASSGCVVDGRMYLVLSDVRERNFSCIVLDEARPEAGFTEIPLPTNCPRSLCAHQGRIFLARYLPGAVFELESDGFTTVPGGALGLEVRGMCVAGSGFVIATPHGLARADHDGRLFATPLPGGPVRPANPYGAAFGNGKIHVSDLSGAMHVFNEKG